MNAGSVACRWRLVIGRAVLVCLFTLVWGQIVSDRALAVGANSLGATYDSSVTHVTFRVYSANATRIEVWLYDQPGGTAEKGRFVLTMDPQTHFFSTTLAVADLATAGISGTIYYSYRAWGPNWTFDPAWTPGGTQGFVSDVDGAGNRFNPNKALFDPYALELSHDAMTPQQTNGAIFCSGSDQRAADTALVAPRGIALKPSDLGAAADATAKPTRPFKDEIVYEVNLRGLTKNDPSIPAAQQGTFAGAAQKAAYLQGIGVTAVEFQPLQEFQDDTNDTAPTTTGNDYWGYNPQNYFAPDRRYASDQSPGGPTREFKALVNAYHAQGLKVYVDMVYNHTLEGDVDATGNIGQLLSWRGLDNSTYYELTSDHRFYWNDNGVGANVNTANDVVRQEIIDALGYWENQLGVDGFRFDLAPVLGNTFTENGFGFNKFDPKNVLNRAVNELPVRPAGGGPGVDLIAEPWTASGDGFEQGNFPSGWAEWNGTFRDKFRTSQNQLGVNNLPPSDLAMRFAGSADYFQNNGRKPWHSVNFLDCHDGFCLRDLYSYNSPQNNQAYPFGPSNGGSSNNISWDQGGDANFQRQAARTGLGIVLLSAGVPMITGGDEFLRTQYGNNNAYNLDTVKNYLDYSNIQAFPHFCQYSARLMAFRNAHPALRPADFFTGTSSAVNGLKDITWYAASGQEADTNYLTNSSNHYLAYRLNGQGVAPGEGAASIYVGYNGWSDWVTATLPPNLPGKQWYRVLDTSDWMESRDNSNAPGQEEALTSSSYALSARSLLLLIEK